MTLENLDPILSALPVEHRIAVKAEFLRLMEEKDSSGRSAESVIESLRRDKAELAEMFNLLWPHLPQELRDKGRMGHPNNLHQMMLQMFPDYAPKVPPPSVVSMQPAMVGKKENA